MLNLTQQEYVNRIEELNQALRESWEQDQRVKALKIGIQVIFKRRALFLSLSLKMDYLYIDTLKYVFSLCSIYLCKCTFMYIYVYFT